MTIGTWEKLTAITEAKMPENDEKLAILSVLTGKTEDELLDEPLPAFREQMDAAGFLLKYPHPAKVRRHYDIGGSVYVPTSKERKLTAGQYIDFQTYAAEQGDNWAGLLSCILVPEGHKYNDGSYDVGDAQEAIREHLGILDAIALRAFFLSSSAASMAATARCSALTAAKKAGVPAAERMKAKAAMLRMEVAVLRHGGGGFRALTRWLRLPEATGIA